MSKWIKSSFSLLTALGLAIGLIGCNSSMDPKPPGGTGTYSKAPAAITTVVRYPVPGPTTILPPSGIGLDDVMEFVVGQEKTYPVAVWVPDPGAPVVSFENLPHGAVFSPEQSTFTWAPTPQDAVDSRDSTSNTRVYKVTLKLGSTKDATYTRSRTFVLIVRRFTGPGDVQ